jgi:hypothetical protein
MQKPLKYDLRRKDTGGYGSDLFSKSSSKRQNCLRIRTAVVVFATRAPKDASTTLTYQNLMLVSATSRKPIDSLKFLQHHQVEQVLVEVLIKVKRFEQVSNQDRWTHPDRI